jgi:M6 family metalloprotease-like protein
MRSLAIVLAVLGPVAWAADPPPADLAEYKAVAQAATTRVMREPAPAKGHLGFGVTADGGRLVVARVEPGGPAEAAGVAAGDVIRSLDGRPVAGLDALRQDVQRKKVGHKAALGVERDGRPLNLSLTCAAPSNPRRIPDVAKPVLGVDLDTVAAGVRVTRVAPGSPADSAGLRVGDVLTRVDGVAATSYEAVVKALAGRFPGESVTLALLRGNQATNVAVELVAAGSQDTPKDMASLAGWDDSSPRFRKPVYRLAVIPVGFADAGLSERIPAAAWNDALFSTDAYTKTSATGQPVFGSMNDYYRELSCGKFRVEGKVFDGIALDKKRVEYTQSASRNALYVEACDQVLKRDGEAALKGFDGVFFIYAGPRFPTQRGGVFWPHRASFLYKGERWPYFICPELTGGREPRMASISVIAHEFGHMLGLPDLYYKADDSNHPGLGIWCTMSVGHGQDGKPLHFSAWCKEQLGWLKPALIDPRVQQKLLLGPVRGSATECYKVLLRADGSEYLLLENRVKRGFDRDLPGEGLLIWRVVDGRPVLEVSHGIAGPDGPRRFLGSVPYPSPSNRAFTPDTTPSSRPARPGGWDVHITDIRRLADGRIAFQIGYEYF